MNAIAVIPTYNEYNNIGKLIEAIARANADCDILVVDDNSPDGTQHLVRNLQGKYNNLHLIVRKEKGGLGTAYVEGFRYALTRSYDTVIQMDADFSHCPEDIIPMYGLLNEFDVVIGSRYARGAKMIGWSAKRFLLSKLTNCFLKLLFDIPVADLTNGFRVIKRSVLESIDFESIRSKGFVFQIELNLLCFLKGFRLGEYPIIYRGRVSDESKMSFAIAQEAFVRIVTLFFCRFMRRT